MILIDKSELLRRLQKQLSALQDRQLEHTLWNHGLIEVVEEVKKMPVVSVGEWISVKDRLPEVPDDRWCIEVLALYHDGEYDFDTYRVMSYCDGKENILNRPKGWYPALSDFLDQFVDHEAGLTHWMYLPKLPKENDDEQVD